MLRLVAKIAVVAVVAIVAGLSTAYVSFVGDQREVTVGAHEAVVSPTFDGWVGIDFGPLLPRLRFPSTGPADLGAQSRLGDTDAQTLDDVIARDAVIASQPSGEIDTVSRALRSMAADAIQRGLGVAVMVVLGLVLAWRAVGPARRRELAVSWRHVDRRRAVVVAVTATSVVVAAMLVYQPRGGETTTRWIALGSAFPDVPDTPVLNRAQVTDTAATSGGSALVKGALTLYRQSQEFYGKLDETAKTVDVRQPEDGETTALVVTDRHDNIGMDPVARTIADRADASLLIDLGDDTSSGAPWEAFSLNSLAREFRGFDVIGIPGNHDTGGSVGRQMKDKGFVVPDGKPIDVDGIRFIGQADPRSTSLAGYRDDENDNLDVIKEQDARLTEAACDDGEVAVAIVHAPASAGRLAKSGCVDLVLSGHLHFQVGPKVVESDDGELTTTLTTGTTGGAVLPIALGSSLRREAQVTVVTFDDDGRPVGLQPVTFKPNGQIEVAEYTPIRKRAAS